MRNQSHEIGPDQIPKYRLGDWIQFKARADSSGEITEIQWTYWGEPYYTVHPDGLGWWAAKESDCSLVSTPYQQAVQVLGEDYFQ